MAPFPVAAYDFQCAVISSVKFCYIDILENEICKNRG
jgi:hypothetical protein